MEMFSGRGQPGCEQLIDRYRIACRPVRDVLVDYLRERQPSVDFSTLQHLAYLLGKLFWADLEAHHPGIDSLQLPREIAAAWKQRVMTRTRTTTGPDGEQITLTEPRLDGRSVLTAVRAFYLDLAEWADDDPARWAAWAVRCPVTASDVSHKKDRSRRKSRMDQRTRERLPVLPALVSWVDAERARTAELLAAAEATRPGEPFTAAGVDAAPHGHEDRDHRPHLGRTRRRRTTPGPDLRRTPRLLDLGDGRSTTPHRVGDHVIPQGCDQLIPQVWSVVDSLAGGRGGRGDGAPGSVAGSVAGSVHEELVAVVDQSVEQGLGDDGVGEQRIPVHR